MLILCKPTSATAVTVLPESVYKSRWCFLRTGCLSKIHCLPLRCHSLELLWSVGYTTYADTPGSHPGQDPSQTFENTYWHNISDTLHLVAYADWSGDSDVSISDGVDGRHPSYHCCHWRGTAQLLHTVAAHCALLRAQEIHGKCSFTVNAPSW